MCKNDIQQNFVEIHGIVTPCEWNNDEQVTAVSIEANDEKEYFVHMKGKGKDLLGLLRKSIHITGAVTCDEHGRKFLTVTDYNIRF